MGLIERRWKDGSLGLPKIIAAVAVAVAAPIKAEPQLHFTFFPMRIGERRAESEGGGGGGSYGWSLGVVPCWVHDYLKACLGKGK